MNIPINGGFQPEIDDPRDAFFIPEADSVYDAFRLSTTEVEKMFCVLEEKMKAIKVYGAFGLDATNMCLVLGVKILEKFKVLDFEMYKGVSCSRTHIRSYCRKMAAYSDDEKLLMHFFKDNLSGVSLEWYMQLERTYIRAWRELEEAFIKHYQYNTDTAPNRT